jgi:hypothetical protein
VSRKPHTLVVDCATGETALEPIPTKQRAADEKAGREVKAASLRAERDARLAASDWTQMPDAPLTDAQRKKWSKYRQELRDLPAKTKDPSSVKWPKSPAE